jgi:hypothetical protein
MKPLAYKHYFSVVNGKYVWENLDMFNLVKRTLEGKRGYAIIEEETEKVSTNQLAYYFGGIIRQECMHSNCFAGLSEKDIHNYLLVAVRGTIREIRLLDGQFKIREMPGDFDEIMRNKADMAKYIEEVIAHLQVEFDIYVKPSSHYKANGYIVKTKHYGIAKES